MAMFNKSSAPTSIWSSFLYSHLAVIMRVIINAWKVSKYGAFSGPYLSVFSLNAGKYGPEKTSYFDPFLVMIQINIHNSWKVWPHNKQSIIKVFHEI